MSLLRRVVLGSLCVVVLAAASSLWARASGAASPAPASSPARETAYRENNLGVALLEQFRFADAAEAFERALQKDPTLLLAKVNLAIAYLYVPDHDAARKVAEAALSEQPDSPQLNYVLGLIARGEGRAEDAVPYLKKVLARDPRDVGANLTLGQVYLQLREYDEAVSLFQTAVAAEPYNVSAVYNLGVALNRSGRRDEAQAALERFQTLRDSGYKTSLGQNYLEQGKYAEALPSTGSEPDVVDPAVPAVSFVERDAAFVGTPSRGAALPARATLGTPVAPAKAARALPRAALTMADVDGDGRLDIVEAGVPTLRVLANEDGRFRDVTDRVGLAGVSAVAAVAGDYDNDGHDDLLVLHPGGLSLFHNDGNGRFQEATSSAHVPGWPHLAVTAAFVDADHDGDLDVLVAGLADVVGTSAGSRRFPEDYAEAPLLLLQNDGDGTFTDVTARAGLGDRAHALAVVPTDFDNRRDVDLFVLRRDAPPALYKNLRDGTFRDVAKELGLVAPGPFRSVAAGDVNKDGYVDFFLGGDDASWLALSDGKGAFEVEGAPAVAAGAEAAQLVDYDNDGLLDLFVVTSGGTRLLRNLGHSWSDVSASAFGERLGTAALDGAALGIADLDRDGDEDAVVATPLRLRYLANEGGNANHSFAVDLAGRVSNRDGVGAKVEIRAGSLRQKLETVAAVPMPAPADVVFGLGARPAPDAVRVIWVSGIVQTETDFPAAPEAGRRASLGVMELDRKPSSCPYLYAWDGERFAFVTDFLGGGEMGYQEAPGVWNVPDPVELVRLAPDQLRPRDGRYELRVTNELEEVLYLDELHLLAVDHPADVSVFPNEGMTEPPKPARLLAVRDPRVPPARDDAGRDVTSRLRDLDRLFVDDLPLLRIRGYAREHGLVLDLGALPSRNTVLLLTGWTDYAFSSDNVAAHQAGLALVPPRLEALQADGTWRTVVEQIGVPVGRPQTVVVDLQGLPLGPSRQVRIVTSMRVYWDRIQAAAPAEDVPLRPATLAPVRADLWERGFSSETSPDGLEPRSYDYASVSWVSPWKTMAGRYTRTGDVRPLLAAADDRFVISKPGDEVALSFDASSLPPVREGFVRTFLLRGDGFSKEMDINSASPDAVQPLPFHGMTRYPYDEGEVSPDVRERWADLEKWTTRRVVRPIAPIELAVAGERAAPPARHEETRAETSR
jgi:Tfp pilus assembly protein PilF